MIGKLICWWRGRHKWGRPEIIAIIDTDSFYGKRCRRCGATAPVKRRKARAT